MTYRLLIWITVVLCVATGSPAGLLAQERLVDNGDGTLTDHQSRLMWTQTDNQGDMDWHQAQRWVRYTLPDTLPQYFDNWRLPTLDELKTLVVKEASYETDCGLKAHITPLVQLSCAWVWTSESDPVAPTARVFNFDNIYHYTVRKAHQRGYRVLAVRNIP